MSQGTYDFDWCLRIITDLLKWPLTAYFRKPVDPEKDGAPNYLEKVKNPIDLSTIKTKLQSNNYKTAAEFMSDIRLIYQNAETYNGENSMITFIAKDIVKWTEDQYSEKCNSYEEEMRHKLHKAMDELNEHLKNEPPLDNGDEEAEVHEAEDNEQENSPPKAPIIQENEQKTEENKEEKETVQQEKEEKKEEPKEEKDEVKTEEVKENA